MGKLKTILILIFSFAAQAEPLDSLSKDHAVCYEHEVTHMKFFVDVNGSPVNQGMPIQVKVRSASEEPGVYSAILLCLSKGNDIECAIECDSGSAPAAWAANIANDGVVFKAQGFTLHGVCGESENTVFVTPHDDNLKLRHVQCPRNP